MAEAIETALACIREEVGRAFSSAPGAVLEAALSRIGRRARSRALPDRARRRVRPRRRVRRVGFHRAPLGGIGRL